MGLSHDLILFDGEYENSGMDRIFRDCQFPVMIRWGVWEFYPSTHGIVSDTYYRHVYTISYLVLQMCNSSYKYIDSSTYTYQS
jgi:hypothetical protein